MDSRSHTGPALADPGTVGAIIVGLATRAVTPGLRLLGGTLQLAQGVVDSIGPAPPQAREVASARIHFPSE